MSQTLLIVGCGNAKNPNPDRNLVKITRDYFNFPDTYNFNGLYDTLVSFDTGNANDIALKGADIGLAAVSSLMGRLPVMWEFPEVTNSINLRTPEQKIENDLNKALSGIQIPKPFIFEKRYAGEIRAFSFMFALVSEQVGIELVEVSNASELSDKIINLEGTSEIARNPVTGFKLFGIPGVENFGFDVPGKDSPRREPKIALALNDGSIPSVVTERFGIPA